MSGTTPVQQLVGLLGGLGMLIAGLDETSYTAPAPGRSSGSVGAHVRHCLDHVATLVAASHTRTCAYDRRVRGTDLETSCEQAVRRIRELMSDLSLLHELPPNVPVSVETQLDPHGAFVVTASSIGREVVFVTNHTIHHSAVISLLLRAQGIRTDPGFGLAPSTPLDARG